MERALSKTEFLVAFSLCLAASVPAMASSFNPADPASSGYTISFSDDFHTLDQTKWERDWWYAKEDACQKAYLPSTTATSASGLDLHIQSLENVPACAAGKHGYSAAHLDLYPGFAQRLGYYEARIKASRQGGTLTAFWLLPASGAWPPEPDIEEIRGDVADTAYMTNHTGTSNKQTQFTYVAPSAFGTAFHTYGLLMTRRSVSWYIDGVQRGKTTVGPGEYAPMFPILSLYTGTCGDGWAGCPSQTTGFSADVQVQWVHVWQAPAAK